MKRAIFRATKQLDQLAELSGLRGRFTVRIMGPQSHNRQLNIIQVNWNGLSESRTTGITPGFGPRDLAEALVELR